MRQRSWSRERGHRWLRFPVRRCDILELEVGTRTLATDTNDEARWPIPHFRRVSYSNSINRGFLMAATAEPASRRALMVSRWYSSWPGRRKGGFRWNAPSSTGNPCMSKSVRLSKMACRSPRICAPLIRLVATVHGVRIFVVATGTRRQWPNVSDSRTCFRLVKPPGQEGTAWQHLRPAERGPRSRAASDRHLPLCREKWKVPTCPLS